MKKPATVKTASATVTFVRVNREDFLVNRNGVAIAVVTFEGAVLQGRNGSEMYAPTDALQAEIASIWAAATAPKGAR